MHGTKNIKQQIIVKIYKYLQGYIFQLYKARWISLSSKATVTFFSPIVMLAPKGRYFGFAIVSFSERYNFAVEKVSLNKQVTHHLYDRYTFTINKYTANKKVTLQYRAAFCLLQRAPHFPFLNPNSELFVLFRIRSFFL
jgi:hypothetical protein